jgi:quercetin dioxygenase-like cupin family protein
MIAKQTDQGMVQMREGLYRQQLVHGERTHLIKFFLDKGFVLQTHAHPQEQTGYLLSGRMIMKIEGSEQTLGPGDSWSIPGNVEHSVQVLEDAVALEVFSPPREDYLKE